MDRRHFLVRSGATLFGGAGLFLSGCRNGPSAEVLDPTRKDKVGTTAAGAETYKPLIEEAVGKLLARQSVIPASAPQVVTAKKVCFVGLENKSSEELGDFKDQICEVIDQKIIQSGVFEPVSRRFVQ